MYNPIANVSKIPFMSAFRGNGRQISAIMSVFFGWQIICYLCAGFDIWKDNV